MQSLHELVMRKSLEPEQGSGDKRDGPRSTSRSRFTYSHTHILGEAFGFVPSLWTGVPRGGIRYRPTVSLRQDIVSDLPKWAPFSTATTGAGVCAAMTADGCGIVDELGTRRTRPTGSPSRCPASEGFAASIDRHRAPSPRCAWAISRNVSPGSPSRIARGLVVFA
jgi:hypothetical protein